MTTVYPTSSYAGYGNQPAYGAPPGSAPGYPPPQQQQQQQQAYPPQGYYLPPGSMAPPPGGYSGAAQPYPAWSGAADQGVAYPTPYNGGAPPPQAAMPQGGGGYPTMYVAQHQQQPPPGGGGGYNPSGGYPAQSPYPAQYPYPAQPAPGGGYEGVTVIAVPITNDPSSSHQPHPRNRIATGKWSAGLCDCCDNCVPNACMAWCCPCVSLAQIYARIAIMSYRKALLRLSLLVFSGFVVQNVPIDSRTSPKYELAQDASGNYYLKSTSAVDGALIATVIKLALLVLIELMFSAAVCVARTRVRRRFQIPGDPCCDGLVSCFCSCCAIAQMATHVKSYKPGSCDFTGPDVLPAFN